MTNEKRNVSGPILFEGVARVHALFDETLEATELRLSWDNSRLTISLKQPNGDIRAFRHILFTDLTEEAREKMQQSAKVYGDTPTEAIKELRERTRVIVALKDDS